MKPIVIVLSLLLLGYALVDFQVIDPTLFSITGFAIKDVQIPNETGRLDIYFCPRDNCTQAFVNLTENSQSFCAFYDLELEEFKNIEFPVITDNDYPIDLDAIYDTSSGLMHNKFCIVNQSIIWTGSMNPTFNGAYKNNNNVLIIESKSLAKNYMDEYLELKSRQFASGQKVAHPTISFNNFTLQNAFCPEDDCNALVLSELAKANDSIYFMTFAFTSTPVANLLIEKSKTLEIKGVMENRNANHPYSQFKRMNEFFLLKKDVNPQTMHHKVFIIDNKTVITGSWNPTAAASSKNDENILVIHKEEIAKMYLEEFELVFIS